MGRADCDAESAAPYIDISNIVDIIGGVNPTEALKALANEHRLRIMQWLKEPTRHFHHDSDVDMEQVGVCVGEIQRVLELTQSTTSQYLGILQKANLVTSTRIGKWTYYRRNEAAIQELRDFIDTEL